MTQKLPLGNSLESLTAAEMIDARARRTRRLLQSVAMATLTIGLASALPLHIDHNLTLTAAKAFADSEGSEGGEGGGDSDGGGDGSEGGDDGGESGDDNGDSDSSGPGEAGDDNESGEGADDDSAEDEAGDDDAADDEAPGAIPLIDDDGTPDQGSGDAPAQ